MAVVVDQLVIPTKVQTVDQAVVMLVVVALPEDQVILEVIRQQRVMTVVAQKAMGMEAVAVVALALLVVTQMIQQRGRVVTAVRDQVMIGAPVLAFTTVAVVLAVQIALMLVAPGEVALVVMVV